MPPDVTQRALQLLRLGSGKSNATFRDGQLEAIRHLVEKRGRLLVVQRTGWGKSFVYFIATKILRDANEGPAILVSPLLALMRNQLQAAWRMGVQAEAIHSDNRDQWDEIEEKVWRGDVDILLVSPERFANERFQTRVLAHIRSVSLLVVDEAHCISDWGHDFRPHYRLLDRFVRKLPRGFRLLATTATANQRVIEDLHAVLGPDLRVVRGDLNRPSLALQTIHLPKQEERLAWLAQNLPHLPGSGIIYTLTIRDAEMVADWLKAMRIRVEAYTGRSDDRESLEQALLGNELKALVATTALGMGYDKPDLGFVIHYQSPGSVVGYYQQVGRAGRALSEARGVLLTGPEDSRINRFFINSAFPTKEEVDTVLSALEEAEDGLSIFELMAAINLNKGRIEKALEALSLESPAPVVKEGSKWRLGLGEVGQAFWDRVDRVTSIRNRELWQMQEYAKLQTGHMRFLIEELDGDASKVGPPPLSPLSPAVDIRYTKAAVEFLRRTSLPFEPRKRWPVGGMPLMKLTGGIARAHQAEPGKALCRWNDAGWGSLVFRGKYETQRFDDALVKACVQMLGEWAPEPAPTWVSCVPSERFPDLVPDFARRLAQALGLPFKMTLRKTRRRPEQKLMANGTQQACNIDGALELIDDRLPEGPVLLVDDMVDSRWTFTVAAWLLRQGGSGEVFPLALAMSAGGSE